MACTQRTALRAAISKNYAEQQKKHEALHISTTHWYMKRIDYTFAVSLRLGQRD